MDFGVVQLPGHCREAVEKKLSAAVFAVSQECHSQPFVGFWRQGPFSLSITLLTPDAAIRAT